jgi:triacylglycerol esterase/lipase EstA (alpha/beta hydrolase family)
MSTRRRLLVLGLAAVLTLLAAVAVLRVTGDRDAGQPSQDRPGPVLLVPGYGGERAGLLELAARISARTGRDAQVLTLPGNGTGDLGAQAAVLDRAADAALAGGAPSVDVVGYSAGGVVAALWVTRSGGASKARRVVSLGSPLHGTRLAGLGAALAPSSCPAACQQLAPGSSVLGEVTEVGARLPWLSVWTANDETVTPPESAVLDGAENLRVQSVCPDAVVAHGQLPTDPLVTGLVLRALSTDTLTPPPATDCATLRAAGT